MLLHHQYATRVFRGKKKKKKMPLTEKICYASCFMKQVLLRNDHLTRLIQLNESVSEYV